MIERDAIGGYFELELPPGHGELYPNALRFQSARAALLALLNAGRPQRIWMPWYNCETMLEPPCMAGIPVRRYRINRQLEIAEEFELGENDWLLCVNYFGICDDLIEKIIARFPRERVIVDNSQALFSPPLDCLATLYSPRKFFGIPDGGYLITDLSVTEPDEQDHGSIQRFEPLLTRIDRGAEAGYEGIRAARATLRGQTPRRMSALTQHLLAHIDYSSASVRRKHNFARYQERLGAVNQFSLSEQITNAPLCYPFWNSRTDLQAKLAAKRIFAAKYWPNVRGSSGTIDDLEYRLANECLALPCDQRYGDDEIDLVVAELQRAMSDVEAI